jgi:hypothetical protein
MFANLEDVGWLIATQWLQLSIAGVAIVHALAEVVRGWRDSGKPRVAMYAGRVTGSRSLPSLERAA